MTKQILLAFALGAAITAMLWAGLGGERKPEPVGAPHIEVYP